MGKLWSIALCALGCMLCASALLAEDGKEENPGAAKDDAAAAEQRRDKEKAARAGFEQQVKPLQEKLENLRREERELAEAGKEDARNEVRAKIGEVEKMLQNLRSEWVGGYPGHPLREHHLKMQQAGQKLMHLQAAAQHLAAAGMQDLAEQLRKQAKEIEQEINKANEEMRRQMKQQAEAQPGPGPGPDAGGVIRELREEIQRLRNELEQLRKQGAKEPEPSSK